MEFNTDSPGAPQRPEGAAGGGFRMDDPVGSFVETVRGVVLAPVGFFSGLQRQGDYLSPLIFALIVWEISALLTSVISVVTGNMGLGGFISALIFAPVFAAVVLFVGSGIFHLLVMLFIKPNSGYEATFRTASYASVPMLVSWVPVVGWIVGLYGVVLAVLGIRELHETSTGKAVLVVLLPSAVALLIGVMLAVVIGAVLFGMLR